MEPHTRKLKPGLLDETESSYTHIQRIVRQRAQTDVGTEVTHTEMGWIKLTIRAGDILLVVTEVGMK